ncbi:hypothetical protein FDA94_06060 [Herbidospora galbida]|uniref:Uncharacterized protein n=1 Tax=Herbidospora galbida TaxID=2575442 RepID=A0A4V6XBH6_9ACTN|nr:hypothetical protein [Herbidospora galbida]TKK90553.1 hypothetical protein FDA94_06060 [Herbidospora galbida]
MLLLTAGCINRISGETAVYKGSTGPAVLFRWCERPTKIHTKLGIYDSDGNWRIIAKFSTTTVSGESASFEIRSPGSGWELETGNPTLSPGVEYFVIAAPGDGDDDSFAQTIFTVDDVASLQPGQVISGSGKVTYPQSEFLAREPSYC